MAERFLGQKVEQKEARKHEQRHGHDTHDRERQTEVALEISPSGFDDAFEGYEHTVMLSHTFPFLRRAPACLAPK